MLYCLIVVFVFIVVVLNVIRNDINEIIVLVCFRKDGNREREDLLGGKSSSIFYWLSFVSRISCWGLLFGISKMFFFDEVFFDIYLENCNLVFFNIMCNVFVCV